MKPVSVSVVVRLALVVGVMVGMAQAGLAADATSGEVSKQLAINLYCGVTDLLEGDIGLLIGLIFVFVGLWSLIQGGKIVAALPMLILGSLITALPTLTLSALSGLGQLLSDTKISTNAFEVETCVSEESVLTQQKIDKAMKDNRGAYYPSRGVYNVPANSSGSPDDRDAD
jgi:hypothetical protein